MQNGINPSLLVTDLYELTMLQAYFDCDMEAQAVFEFFVRELPPDHGYLVALGQGLVLDYLQQARLSEQELSWLQASGHFSPAFLDSLAAFRFRGEVHAMPEGTPFFANEPILRVTAPLPQAQLVETRIINLLQYSILAGTKASRCVQAAPDHLMVDFGLRRAHGAEAGLLAARASYIAGFEGSSNVAAAAQFGIRPYGTMAHSFIQAHDSELQAFANFAHAQPDNVVLLIDTYDTELAARKLGQLARRLRQDNITIRAVRLDSGDLNTHAHKVRQLLDQQGLTEVKIFASGGLDEYQVAALMQAGAPIDGFGIGSRLTVSAGAPYLDCAYKLVEYGAAPRCKLSEQKATLPGPKQVYRRYDDSGRAVSDTVATAAETGMAGEPLLRPIMAEGQALQVAPGLDELRDYHRAQMQTLRPALRSIAAAADYPVFISDSLQRLHQETETEVARRAREELMSLD